MAAGDDPAHTRAYTSEGPGATREEGTPAPSEDAAEPKGRLGRYVLQERLGAGGMGVVFAAHDPELDRKVALKVLRGGAWDQPGSSPPGQARLLREAQAMARLSHPNVVAIHDVGQADGRVFVAAEYVDGWNVRQWLAAARRRWRDIVRVYLEAGRGLAAAHAAELVHRDFKPDNVLVARDGRVRVTDFGLARPAQDTGGPVAGTPAYMSPEQRAGSAVDARSDQFSFAAALHEGLSGRSPRRIRRVVARALAPDSRDRYPTMAALLEELERAARFRWRGWLLMGGTGALLVALWPGVQLSRARALAACADATGALTATWNPGQQAQIRQAFARTGLAYAGTSAAEVERRLTAELGSWREARREACAATHLGRTQAPEVLALRLDCLDGHLHDVRALVDLFRGADAALVQSSADVLSTVAPMSRCADVRALLQRPPAPTGADSRARQLALHETLVRMNALGKAARWKDGLALAAPALAGARQLHDGVLEADAQLLEGLLHFGAKDYARAERALLEAMATAEASRHEEVRVRAAIALAEVMSEQGQNERAVAFVKLARAALGRLAPRPDLEGRILFVEARTLTGDPAAAIERCRQAVARFEASPGPDSNEVAVVENMLGWLLTVRGEHEAALPHLRRAVATTRKLRGGLHPNLAVALGNLSLALRATGHHRELAEVLEEQIRVAEANYRPPPPELGVVRARLAVAYWVLGQTETGRRQADRAVEILRASVGERHPDFAVALAASGAVHLGSAQHRQARADFERSLLVLAAALGERPALAEPLLGLAAAALYDGRPAGAIAPLERAHRLPALARNEPALAALVQALLGRALLEAGRDPARGRRLLAEARPLLAPTGRVVLRDYPAAIADELEAYYQAHLP